MPARVCRRSVPEAAGAATLAAALVERTVGTGPPSAADRVAALCDTAHLHERPS
jgi:hypothetical protein